MTASKFDLVAEEDEDEDVDPTVFDPLIAIKNKIYNSYKKIDILRVHIY